MTAILLVAGAVPALAADAAPTRRNTVYGEILGNTLLGASYERVLARHASLRIGVGVAAVNEGGAVGAVVMPTLVLGSARRQIDAAVGALFVKESSGHSYAAPTASVAYRYRRPGGFFLRAGLAFEAGQEAKTRVALEYFASSH